MLDGGEELKIPHDHGPMISSCRSPSGDLSTLLVKSDLSDHRAVINERCRSEYYD